MAKFAPGASLPPHVLRQLKAQGLYVQNWRGRLVLRRHRAPPADKATPLQLENREAMKRLAAALGDAAPWDQVYARALARHTQLTYRDILALTMTGRFVTVPGELPPMEYPDLDLIGTLPGSILVRENANWTLLPFSANGEVLTLVSGLPRWRPPTAGGGAGATISAAVLAAPVVFNPTPTAMTVIPGLGLTLAGGAAARIVLASANMRANPGRYRLHLCLDGVPVFVQTMQVVNVDGILAVCIGAYPVTIPGDGASHLLDLRISAAGSTLQTTLEVASALSVIQ